MERKRYGTIQAEHSIMDRFRKLPDLPRAKSRGRSNEDAIDRSDKVEWRPIEEWRKVDWIFAEDDDEDAMEEIESIEDGQWIDYSMEDEEMADYAVEECDW
jgi:hypothetical protein